jgi:SAV_6107-like HEPN
MSALIDFPLTRQHRPGPGAHLAGATPGSAAALVRQARAGVAEAQHEADPAQRYATAYLAALRAAAAMLALRGRPHRGRARPTSAWVLLTRLAPELSEWAVFFASASATRAAILAGVTRNVSQRSADDLVREAAQFTDLVAEAVAGHDPDAPGESP